MATFYTDSTSFNSLQITSSVSGALTSSLFSISSNNAGIFSINNVGTVSITGSLNTSGSVTLVGALNASGGVTGSLFGTSSFALSSSQAQTASYVNPLNQNIQITGSLNTSGSIFFPTLVTSSTTVSNVVMYGTNGQLFITASSAIGGGGISGDYVTTASFNAYTGSSTSQFAGTASFAQTASYVLSASYALSASQAQTASYVVTAQTASYVLSASYALSSSQAQTASYVLNAQTASYVQNAQTASYVLNAVSASYALSSSQAQTASYVVTAQTASYVLNAVSASYALSSSQAQTASYVLNAISASYALNGGVTQLLAGPNVTLSPTNGLGQVTISSTSGGGGFNTATGSYGSFYSTQTQTNVASTARSMSLNTTDISNGVSISGSTNPYNTYIKTENAGVYNIQFSAQVDKSDFGPDEIWIWLRKNGTNLTETATSIKLTGNADHQVAAWNFFVNAAANDYFQLMWYSTDANVRLHAEPAFGVVPGIPSVIVTANRVDQFLSNTGSFSGSFTGSLLGTASFATTASQAQTASYVLNAVSASYALSSSQAATASYVITAQTASYALSSSQAQTASFVNTLNQNVLITGSLNVTGSTTITGSLRVSSSLTALTNGFVGVGSNTPISILHLGNGSGTSLGDFTTPAITFNTLNQGIYLDSNRLFFKVAGAFNFGIDSTGVLGNQFRINSSASNNVTTPIFVPSRNSLGPNSGFGGNNAGDVCLITSGSTRLRINYNGDLGFFGVTPAARQTLGSATAGATYGANEQTMLQKVYDALRNYGLGT